MRRVTRFTLLTIGAGLVVGVFAVAAQAFHIPGAPYTGSHSASSSLLGPPPPPPPPPPTPPPCTPGGGAAVELVVSPDGLSVTCIRINNVPGSSCTINFSQTGNIPISNHSFSFSGGGDVWSGSFQSVRSAQGTYRSTSGCITPTVNWTATTNASPAGTEECLNANAAVASAEQAVKKAKKKVKKADDQEEKKKAKKKLKKAKQELQAAQAQQAAVCG
jgi:predicted Zn-dependent peptidase